MDSGACIINRVLVIAMVGLHKDKEEKAPRSVTETEEFMELAKRVIVANA